MSYATRYYTFNGTERLADEVAYLAVKNDCRVASRTSTGFFKKEHRFEVFGPDNNMNRFESEMANAKRNIK